MTVLDDPARPRVRAATTRRIDGFTITGGVAVGLRRPTSTTSPAASRRRTARPVRWSPRAAASTSTATCATCRSPTTSSAATAAPTAAAIRVGTPYVGDNRNSGLVLAHNQIRDNGGTNLAGGIGLFTGSDGYQVDRQRDLRQPLRRSTAARSPPSATRAHRRPRRAARSATTGSGSTSPTTRAAASWSPASCRPTRTACPPGSGPVTIDAQRHPGQPRQRRRRRHPAAAGERLAHHAGPTRRPITITNNTIANNVSAHEGGGIALDDAAFVNIVNNTVAKQPHHGDRGDQRRHAGTGRPVDGDEQRPAAGPAAQHAAVPGLARTLAATTFSKPTLLNDVFCDNRAGTFVGGWVYRHRRHAARRLRRRRRQLGHGRRRRPGRRRSPRRSSVLQTTPRGRDRRRRATRSPTTPGLEGPVRRRRSTCSPRGPTRPSGRRSIVAEILPLDLLGDYHLTGTGSPAYGAGRGQHARSTWGTGLAGGSYTVAAPDARHRRRRPAVRHRRRTRYDAGSDQLDRRDARPGRTGARASRQPPPHHLRRGEHSDRRSLTGRCPGAAFLTGGAGVAGAAAGRRPADRRRRGRPAAAPARRGRGAAPAKKPCTWSAPTAGSSMPAGAPADPPFFPDPLAPSPFNTYVFGFRDVTGLTRGRRSPRSAGKAQISAPMLSFDEEDDIYHHADQPGPAAAAGPLRRAHPALARLRQRDPALRRRARAVARGAGRPRLHLLLPPARRRHVHVPLPLRGRRARADGHDRHGLRPARSRTASPIAR